MDAECDKLMSQQDDMLAISRSEAEKEYLSLLGRLQHLGKLLGKPPLQTGKQQRRERSDLYLAN